MLKALPSGFHYTHTKIWEVKKVKLKMDEEEDWEEEGEEEEWEEEEW